MKALVFSYQLPRLAFAMFAGKVFPQVFFGPLGPTRYTDIPEPTLPAPDWCIVRVALCGICGSITKTPGCRIRQPAVFYHLLPECARSRGCRGD